MGLPTPRRSAGVGTRPVTEPAVPTARRPLSATHLGEGDVNRRGAAKPLAGEEPQTVANRRRWSLLRRARAVAGAPSNKGAQDAETDPLLRGQSEHTHATATNWPRYPFTGGFVSERPNTGSKLEPKWLRWGTLVVVVVVVEIVEIRWIFLVAFLRFVHLLGCSVLFAFRHVPVPVFLLHPRSAETREKRRTRLGWRCSHSPQRAVTTWLYGQYRLHN